MPALRVGIDIRFVQGTFGRGMGRYTLQQLNSVIRATPDNQYVIFCLKNIPPSIKAFSQYANVTLENRFVRYNQRLFTKHIRHREALTRLIDRLAWDYKLDIIHIPMIFNFIQPIPTQFTTCPVTMTLYDFIPLIFKEHFPQPPSAQRQYDMGIDRYKQADSLIAISEATKHDCMRILGYPESQIFVANPAVDTSFTRLDEPVTAERLSRLWARLKITPPRQYIFTVTDHFYTKNLDTLLIAYSQLPADIRAITPLIVTFDIYPKDRVRFSARADELGIGEQVIFTGKVPEDDLVALYNGALFTVYPSRYEGFGYPIAEAMLCGSPVITTNTSSMPEVAGDKAILVNPESADEMCHAMLDLYQSPKKRQSMRESGYSQAKKFSLEALTEATIFAYEQTVSRAPVRPSTKPPSPPIYARSRLILSYYLYWVKRVIYDYITRPLFERLNRH